MTEIIQVQQEANEAQRLKKEFMNDVKRGLSHSRKYLPSKFFYDEAGSELFNQITRHPDYYLADIELEILSLCQDVIADAMGDAPFNLVELGPGEGIKTGILLNAFMQDKLAFTYTPIDISARYLENLTERLNQYFPEIKITPIQADYAQGINWVSHHSHQKNLVLFLGSSIGNFDLVATNQFLKSLHVNLNHQDVLLLGFDLRKKINILLKAYDDTAGITRDFNLNLLSRINRELGGNFKLNHFQHYATYNVYTGAMESYLISLISQKVQIEALNTSFTFEKMEPILMEYSHKYSLPQIEALATENGFHCREHFLDNKHYFTDSLWEVKK